MKTISKNLFLVFIAVILTCCSYTMSLQYSEPTLSQNPVSHVIILPVTGVHDYGIVIETVVATLAESDIPVSIEQSRLTLVDLEAASAFLEVSLTKLEQGVPSFFLGTPTKISAKWSLVLAETGETVWSTNYSKSSRGRGDRAPEVEEIIRIMAQDMAFQLSDSLI